MEITSALPLPSLSLSFALPQAAKALVEGATTMEFFLTIPQQCTENVWQQKEGDSCATVAVTTCY